MKPSFFIFVLSESALADASPIFFGISLNSYAKYSILPKYQVVFKGLKIYRNFLNKKHKTLMDVFFCSVFFPKISLKKEIAYGREKITFSVKISRTFFGSKFFMEICLPKY